MPAPTSILPSIDATLNGITAVLLGIGRWQISRRRVASHRAIMIAACVTSAVFLCFYLYYHYRFGDVLYEHHGVARDIYLVILASHVILAIIIVPLVLITLSRALRKKFVLHKHIARWTWPLWMYVSVTGVVVYYMLYYLDR